MRSPNSSKTPRTRPSLSKKGRSTPRSIAWSGVDGSRLSGVSPSSAGAPSCIASRGKDAPSSRPRPPPGDSSPPACRGFCWRSECLERTEMAERTDHTEKRSNGDSFVKACSPFLPLLRCDSRHRSFQSAITNHQSTTNQRSPIEDHGLTAMNRSLRSWLWRVPLDQEVDEELALHVELRTRELVERGLTPKAARDIVLSRIGDLGHLKRTCVDLGRKRDREMRVTQWLDERRHDVRFA